MNHKIPNLQVHIHKVDGSTTTFVQNDAGEVKKLLDEFQPTQIFNRDRISFTDKNSITSFPVSNVTRIDLESEKHSHLLFPIGVVDAVELNGTEFEALIRNPVMREQWDQISSPDASLVTFLDVEMADGQCLFLTVEMQAELQSELWKTMGFPLNGLGFCFRMRTGGVAVLNLAHLTRLTFFPKPLHTLADNWHAQQFRSQQTTKHMANSHSGTPVVVNPPATPPQLTPLFQQDKRTNSLRK
jgi:hypothetical protein